MTDKHTLIVLHTDRHVQRLERAMYDFSRPFTVIQSMPETIRHLEEVYDGVLVRDAIYVGTDKRVTIGGIPTPVSRQRIEGVLVALINEAMTQALMYRASECATVDVARHLFATEDPTVGQLCAVETRFLCHPQVDEVIMDILVDMNVVRENPWREWNLIRGHKMMSLLGGKDYRIKEWEQTHLGQPQSIATNDTYQINFSSLINFAIEKNNSAVCNDGKSNPPIDWLHGLYVVAMTLGEVLPNVNMDRGDYPYQPFHNELWLQETVVRPALKTLMAVSRSELPPGCDDVTYHTHYSGLLRRDGTLVIQETSHNLREEELERRAIIEAVQNQDYVPERLRRKYRL